MKRNIGIDIDSTSFDTDTEMLNHIGLYYNECFNKKDIRNGFEDFPGVSQKVIRNAIDLAVSNTNSRMHKYAKKVIRWLSEYYNIYFITYRSVDFADETKKLLNRFGVHYNLIMLNRKDGKSNSVLEKNIKIMIEDDTETIIDIVDKTDCVCLIFNQPWNERIKQNWNKVRVYNWKEIMDYLVVDISRGRKEK